MPVVTARIYKGYSQSLLTISSNRFTWAWVSVTGGSFLGVGDSATSATFLKTRPHLAMMVTVGVGGGVSVGVG